MADNIVKLDFTGTMVESIPIGGVIGEIFNITGYVELNYTTETIVDMHMTAIGNMPGQFFPFSPGLFYSERGQYFLRSADTYPEYTIVFSGEEPSQALRFDLAPTSGYEVSGVIYANVIDSEPVCFLSGTMIRTPRGEVAVEDLAIGDLVATATGEALPVRWIGRTVMTTRFVDPHRAYPVRIRAGALGGGLPARDLFVSPAHAIWIDGVLVQARVLADGGAIAQVRPQGECFTYYHVEFDTHAVLFAEGLPAESYVDSTRSRHRFDNHAEFVALYGHDAAVAEPSDAPRVTCQRQMPRRLAAQVARRVDGTEAHARSA